MPIGFALASASPAAQQNDGFGWLIPATFCAIACYFGPRAFLDDLARMPAGLGDSRLTAFFLEHFCRYLAGDSASLRHLPIYYPRPYALGFSDNLFASAPIYGLLRFSGLDALSAYQWWFLAAARAALRDDQCDSCRVRRTVQANLSHQGSAGRSAVGTLSKLPIPSFAARTAPGG